MVQESWEKLGFGHWIDGKSETESELWWEEALRAVWGHLDDLLLQQRACSTMAQEGALGVPVRSHSKSRQTPLPDRYTLWLQNGLSNEVSERILDDSCSFRFPFPPRSVRVYLQVFLYKTTPPLPGEGRCWWHLSSEWTLWVPVRCWVHITASACCVISQALRVFSVLKWINVHELQSVTWTEIVRKMFPSKWFPLCTHKYIPLKNNLKIPDFPEDIADDL